jgi:hypothetical protein
MKTDAELRRDVPARARRLELRELLPEPPPEPPPPEPEPGLPPEEPPPPKPGEPVP